MSTFITPLVGQYKPGTNQEKQECVRGGVNLLAFEKG
jgi:hypothetical protein